jgi:2-succinyl-5-enolpyruvyl-6-hydroxy-3-cyclohexene-1-carboxylate synthase
MYSIKSHIQQLVSLLIEHDVTQVVLCPGSRNAPIVQTIVSSDEFVCHSVVDERSAGFYAIGMFLSTNKPVAVCCTSGSALLNLAPAVAEAYYQKIPLLIISADRPKQWINQMDGQTLTQTNVFNDYIKKEVQLVEENDGDAKWYNNRMINEAIVELTHTGYGPAHINIPISEPLFDFSATNLPKERAIIIEKENVICIPKLEKDWELYNKVLVVCGQYSKESTPYNFNILKDKGCVTFCELLSNCKFNESQIINFDTILYKISQEGKLKNLTPDLVISMGGHIVSKRLKKFLRENHVRHWLVNSDGKITDTYMNLDKVIVCSETDFIKQINKLPKKNDKFQQAWWTLSNEVNKHSKTYFRSIKSEMSAMNVLGNLMSRTDNKCVLLLANSMTVRLAQLFHSSTKYIPTFCNRGVNGIEGSLSTAVGYANMSTDLCISVIGDLSFFYDMNVLRHAVRSKNLRILLINNGGGEIFQTLRGLDDASALEQYISACHTISAEGWAKELGFTYLKIIDAKHIDTALDALFNPDSNQPVLIEAITNSTIDKNTLNNYYKSLSL